MTPYGGTKVAGIIFSINLDGSQFTIVHGFDPKISGYPNASLILFGNTFYGMTYQGDTTLGSIFSVHTDGSGYKTLFMLNGTTGYAPYGSLVIYGSKLYGMLNAYRYPFNPGCIFSIDTNGSGYKILQIFNDTTSGNPQGSLVCTSGVLYGMTCGYNQFSSGNIFSIDTDGSRFNIMHWFNDSDANASIGTLTLLGGTLYGTASGGRNGGCIFSIDTSGMNYKDLYIFNKLQNNPVGYLTISGDMMYGMLSQQDIKGRLGLVFSFRDTAIHISQPDTLHPVSGVKIFPNPGNGLFTVDSRLGATIKIYDVLGQEVYNAALNQSSGFTTINLEFVSKGVYFYRVSNTSGDLTGKGKLVIGK